MPEEIVDIKARADLAAHEAVCEVLRTQATEDRKLNREEHGLIIDKIETISRLLAKYDKHAILRWVLFGGTLLMMLGTAIVNHWFDAAYSGQGWL